MHISCCIQKIVFLTSLSLEMSKEHCCFTHAALHNVHFKALAAERQDYEEFISNLWIIRRISLLLGREHFFSVFCQKVLNLQLGVIVLLFNETQKRSFTKDRERQGDRERAMKRADSHEYSTQFSLFNSLGGRIAWGYSARLSECIIAQHFLPGLLYK